MELTHHHKHIRNTSICGTILTEKTCAAKAVGKINTESGRKRREQSDWDLHPREKPRKKSGITWSLRGVKCLTHMLGTSSLGSNTREISPHKWFENQCRNFLDSPVVGALPSSEGVVVLNHGQGDKTLLKT